MQRRPPPRRPNNNRNRRRPQNSGPRAAVVEREPEVRVQTGPVELPAALTVKEFSERLNVPLAQIIRELLQNGIIANINHTIDFDTAAIVASDLGIEVIELSAEDQAAAAAEVEERPEDLEPRPPIVTVMGHVDHGKTSLLDAIRKTHVTAGEFGGITQHIGAYQTETHGQKITFLDTPGHEAFTAMRARGAKATDIAVLVVAADDGVMPTTKEAAEHAKAAGVPIVVALNKIDRPNINPDRVKQQLTDIGLVPHEYGGDTEVIPVSARTGEGLDNLLETILLVSEIGNYRANPHRPAAGVVIEAKLDKARGPVATVLVENGTLNTGDVIVAGGASGRIKALFNDKGKHIKSAEPALPVEVLGLDGVPEAGDRFLVVQDQRQASVLAQKNRRTRDAHQPLAREATLEAIMEGIRTGALKDLNLVVKADVRGSLEALMTAIQQVAESEEISREVRTKIVRGDTGNVTENDVNLAGASQGIVIAFNVRVEPGARRAAEAQGVEIKSYNVIYHMTEELQALLSGMLAPEYHEVIQGEGEVRQVFKIGRNYAAAGCHVTSGTIHRNDLVRIIRGGETLYQGRIESLRRFKDEVREVTIGYEFGLTLPSYADYEEGDVIQAFTNEVVS
ncbi:MAG: translation initiation factor [Chloroflexota bacterium]|jgi:translation initiation factor IF-2|nr:translation initiation factor [Chloroflexota bacterium]